MSIVVNMASHYPDNVSIARASQTIQFQPGDLVQYVDTENQKLYSVLYYHQTLLGNYVYQIEDIETDEVVLGVLGYELQKAQFVDFLDQDIEEEEGMYIMEKWA